MAKVTVYSANYCPYCARAKALLDKKGVTYEEIPVDLDPDQRQIMETRSQRMTVPQIFIGERHVGGYDELYALEKSGQLDALLSQTQ